MFSALYPTITRHRATAAPALTQRNVPGPSKSEKISPPPRLEITSDKRGWSRIFRRGDHVPYHHLTTIEHAPQDVARALSRRIRRMYGRMQNI